MIKITKKEKLIEVFNNAIEFKSSYIAVEVQTDGSKKNGIIINPYENFEKKLKYYKIAYDDDLVLKTYDGIRIVSAIFFREKATMIKIEDLLKVMRF